MPVQVHKWIGPFPERQKKKGLRLNLSGNYHLSNKVAQQSIQEKFYGIGGVNEVAVLIAFVMSLWRNSTAQISKITEVADLGMKTATTAISPCTIRTHKGHGSKDHRLVNDVTNLSRKTWKALKSAHLPVNIFEETGLVEIKDFISVYGTKIVNIPTDVNTTNATCPPISAGQNCSQQARDMLGDCKTVVKFTNQKATTSVHVITEEQIQNSILGLLPIVSSVIQANNLYVLLVVQAHAIVCVITARLFLLKSFLKQCESLGGQGRFKVNQTVLKSDISSANNCAETARIKENTCVSVNPANSSNIFNMANRGANNPNGFGDLGGHGAGGMGADGREDYFGGNNQAHGEDAGLQQVPDFHQFVDDGEMEMNEDLARRLRGDDEQDLWEEEMFENLRVVPVVEPKHPLEDEFANQLIYDPEELAVLLGDLNPPPEAQPLPDDNDLVLEEEWLEFPDAA